MRPLIVEVLAINNYDYYINSVLYIYTLNTFTKVKVVLLRQLKMKVLIRKFIVERLLQVQDGCDPSCVN